MPVALAAAAECTVEYPSSPAEPVAQTNGKCSASNTFVHHSEV